MIYPGYLNDALAVHMYTYEESAHVCVCVRVHAWNSFRLDCVPPPPRFFLPSAFISFFFLSLSLAFVSFRLRGITSRRNHGNHAAGAESVGMQALICRAIRYKAIYGATGRIATSGGRLTSFFLRVRFIWFFFYMRPLVLEMTGACSILRKYSWHSSQRVFQCIV